MLAAGADVSGVDFAQLNRRLRNALLPASPEEEPQFPAPTDLEPTAPTEPMTPEAQAVEAVLVQQARQDPAAFGALYEHYVERIYAYIYHRVNNVQDAEDLTARTFYRALDHLDRYEDRGAPFAAWLFRIAHNLIANWYRERSRRRFLSLDNLWGYSRGGDSPEQQLEQSETHAALWSAINRLPEERRKLLQFKFGEQMSNLEIGALLNKSESAIKSLYFRTLAALRQDLEARGWTGQSAEAERVVPAHTSALAAHENGTARDDA